MSRCCWPCHVRPPHPSLTLALRRNPALRDRMPVGIAMAFRCFLGNSYNAITIIAGSKAVGVTNDDFGCCSPLNTLVIPISAAHTDNTGVRGPSPRMLCI